MSANVRDAAIAMVPNQYNMTLLAAYRARQIVQSGVKYDRGHLMTTALKDVGEGRVTMAELIREIK